MEGVDDVDGGGEEDAVALEAGGMKLEATWRKDAQQRGVEGVFGFSPLPSLEVGVAVAQDRDHATHPASRLSAVGLGFKWVPIQNKTGWSLGGVVAQVQVNGRFLFR